MPRHPVKIIVNPHADLGRAWLAVRDLRPVVEEFGGADWAGTVYPTHAMELAQQAGEQGYELVIAAGGDGTTHEVVNGLMKLPSGRRPRLGIVPLGSGNDFAYMVGMPRDPLQALRRIFTGQPEAVDIGVIRDNLGREEYWVNTLGIGFDAVVNIRSRRFRLFRGFFIYFLAALQTILLNHQAPRFRFVSDKEQWERSLLMLVLCNGSREGGGFFIQPAARADDGLLNYACVERVSRLMMFRLVPEVMRGTHGRFRQVHLGEFARLELDADLPLAIHTDGEVFAIWDMNVHRLSVEVVPGQIEIVS